MQKERKLYKNYTREGYKYSRKERITNTLCPKKVSPLNVSQQPPQTCTDLNEILHTQDDICFCHRRQISQESLIPFTRCSFLSNCCHKSQLPIQLTSCWRHLWKLMTCGQCYLNIHISVKSRRIYMKLRSNVCNRCLVCAKFYLNRSRFAVVVVKC